MHKARIIVLVIAAFIVAGAAYLLLSSDDKAETQDMRARNDASTSASRDSGGEASAGASNGQYVDYEEGIVARTAGTKLLFFHAPWCPQCRALESDIAAKGAPEAVTIIKVDYDSNQGLRKKYGVTIQTTVVRVDDAGNLVEKFVAYDDPTIEAVTKQLL